ncbi:MAG: hypothetical protein K0S74_1473 [Chlamydiales bacterium]|jgi:hypothetical protein|nr:hypothetical protein [Chlamydiales bacterium]
MLNNILNIWSAQPAIAATKEVIESSVMPMVEKIDQMARKTANDYASILSYISYLNPYNYFYPAGDSNSTQSDVVANNEVSTFPLLTEMVKEELIKPTLELFYGQNLINKVLGYYEWFDKTFFTPLETKVILASAAAQVTREDVAVAYSEWQKLDLEVLKPFLKAIFPITDLLAIEKLILSSKPFEELNIDEMNLVMTPFQMCVLTEKGSQPITISKYELSQLPKATSMRVQETSLTFAEVLRLSSEYVVEEDIPGMHDLSKKQLQKLATSEYFSREIAYSSFTDGKIIPSIRTDGKREFLEIVKSINEKGVRLLILQSCHRTSSVNIRVLARGTIFSNVASAIHNLADSVGQRAARSYKDEVIKAIKISATKLSKSSLSIHFHGHSQGGTISQHLCRHFVKALTEETTNSFENLKEVDLIVWNSPAALDCHAKYHTDNLKKIATNNITKNCQFGIHYCKVKNDPFQSLGCVFLGRDLYSNNVTCSITIFDEPARSWLPRSINAHCQTVFNKNRYRSIIRHKASCIELEEVYRENFKFLQSMHAHFHRASTKLEDLRYSSDIPLSSEAYQFYGQLNEKEWEDLLQGTEKRLIEIKNHHQEIVKELQATHFYQKPYFYRRIAGLLIPFLGDQLETFIHTRSPYEFMVDAIEKAPNTTTAAVIVASAITYMNPSIAYVVGIPLGLVSFSWNTSKWLITHYQS